MTIQLTSKAAVDEWAAFIKERLATLPLGADDADVETTFRAIRDDADNPVAAIFIQQQGATPVAFSYCYLVDEVGGAHSGFVYALCCTPQADSKSLVFNHIIPWFKRFGVAKMLASDNTFSAARERWFGQFGLKPASKLFLREI